MTPTPLLFGDASLQPEPFSLFVAEGSTRNDMAGDEDRAQKLLQQVQAALQALGEGRLRTASGLHAVGELRKQLEALAERLHLDLRKVQESIVEHAAMYANCPEVLGGMLQLVFCLDHVKTWIQERDVRVQRAEERLEVLHKEFEDCNMRYTTLEVEVGECNQRASALELRVDPVHTPTTRAPHESPRSQASVAGLTGINAAPQQAVPKFFTVDLQALEHTDENVRKLQDLRRENESLRAQLEDANVEIAAATSAANAARDAAGSCCPGSSGSASCALADPERTGRVAARRRFGLCGASSLNGASINAAGTACLPGAAGANARSLASGQRTRHVRAAGGGLRSVWPPALRSPGS